MAQPLRMIAAVALLLTSAAGGAFAACEKEKQAQEKAEAASSAAEAMRDRVRAQEQPLRQALRLAREAVERLNCDWEGRDNPACVPLQANYRDRVTEVRAAENTTKTFEERAKKADDDASFAEMDWVACENAEIRKAQQQSNPPPPEPPSPALVEKGIMGIVDNMPDSPPPSLAPPVVVVIPGGSGRGPGGRPPGGNQGGGMPTGGGEPGHTHDPITGKDVPNPCAGQNKTATPGQPASSASYKTMAPTKAMQNPTPTSQQSKVQPASSAPDKAMAAKSMAPNAKPNSALSSVQQLPPTTVGPKSMGQSKLAPTSNTPTTTKAGAAGATSPQLASTGHPSGGLPPGPKTQSQTPGTKSNYPSTSGRPNMSGPANAAGHPNTARHPNASGHPNAVRHSNTAAGKPQRSKLASLPSHRAQPHATKRQPAQSRNRQVRQRHASARHTPTRAAPRVHRSRPSVRGRRR